MDSNTPYATYVYDMYTETKMEAEKRVRAANGKEGLLTCAIRPAGIYGGEKNYMLDRFVEEVASGKVLAAIGNPSAVHDNSFIDNLVHGHVLAAEALVADAAACGNAYFITDDEPMNYFEFFRPILLALGHRFPKFWIPNSALRPIMVVWQWLHFKGFAPPVMLSPKELDKVSITHFSNNKDALRDLGYEPVKTTAEAMEVCIPYCQELYRKLKAK
jgi:3beta-hydroxy-delta5-steroid dehydrogenase/steroid delta-isomerase